MLNKILDDLSYYHNNKAELLVKYITLRLNKSYCSYESEINEKVDIALRNDTLRNTKKVLKKL